MKLGDYFRFLDKGLFCYLLCFLEAEDLCRLRLLSSEWKKFAESNEVWKTIFYKKIEDISSLEFKKNCSETYFETDNRTWMQKYKSHHLQTIYIKGLPFKRLSVSLLRTYDNFVFFASFDSFSLWLRFLPEDQALEELKVVLSHSNSKANRSLALFRVGDSLRRKGKNKEAKKLLLEALCLAEYESQRKDINEVLFQMSTMAHVKEIANLANLTIKDTFHRIFVRDYTLDVTKRRVEELEACIVATTGDKPLARAYNILARRYIDYCVGLAQRSARTISSSPRKAFSDGTSAFGMLTKAFKCDIKYFEFAKTVDVGDAIKLWKRKKLKLIRNTVYVCIFIVATLYLLFVILLALPQLFLENLNLKKRHQD